MQLYDFSDSLSYTVMLRESSESLEGSTVAKDLSSRIISVLRERDSGTLPQHQLLYGVSGIGKSTVLLSLYRTVAHDVAIGAKWFPLMISEPQYNVTNAEDFWMNCLQVVADRFPASVKFDPANSADPEINGSPVVKGDSKFECLLKSVTRQEKRLLLMVDDIDALLSRSDELSVELLSICNNEPRIFLIGTVSAENLHCFVDGVKSSECFQTFEIKGVAETEMIDAMRRLGRLHPSHNAEKFLDLVPERGAMLHRLTGGNPRAMAFLYGLIASGVDGDIREKVSSLLDAATAAYRQRINCLSVGGQRIVDAVAASWRPIAISELRDIPGMNADSVNRDLTDLEQRGLIEHARNGQIPEEPTIKMTESLFFIWYLYLSRRSIRTRNLWLVRFLQEFFSAEEIERRSRIHIQMPSPDKRETEYVMALAQVVDDRALGNALEFSILRILVDSGLQVSEITPLFYWREGDQAFLQKAEYLIRIKAIENRVVDALSGTAIFIQPFREALMGFPSLTEKEKSELAEGLSSYSEEDRSAINQFLMDEAKRWRRMLGHHAVPLYKSIAAGEMSHLADTEGAESAAEHWQSPVIVAVSWAAWIDSVERPSKKTLVTIEEIFRRSIEVDPKVALIWNSLGNLLHVHLHRYAEAEKAYRTAIELDPQYIAPWSQLASLLKNHLTQYEDAEIAYRKTIELDPENPTMYNNFAWFLDQQCGRGAEALTLSDRAVDLDPNDLYGIHTRAILLVKYGDWQDAQPFVRRYLEHADKVSERILWHTGVVLFREVIDAGYTAQINLLLNTLDYIENRPFLEKALVFAASEDSHDLSAAARDINSSDRDNLGNLKHANPG